MNWWTSVVNGYKTISETITYGMQWAWDTGTPWIARTVSFTTGTAFQFAEQGLALRTALPTLVNDPAAKKIAYGMFQVVVYDVLPIVGLNYLNTGMQSYFRAGHEEEAWFTPYSAFLTGLTLVNYGVKAYTYRQGAQVVARTLVLDSLAPAAFNSYKTTPGLSACIEEECTTKRFLSGMLREPLILRANDALTDAVSFIPYVGTPASTILRMICIGRYITRLVTPERCERHKYMMPESVLALGIAHEAALWAMNASLGATVGELPFLQHRTMQHMLTLLFVNLAAHMPLPLVKPKEATALVDVLNKYEQLTRFGIDVLFAGLLKRIPIDFAPDPKAPPLIPIDKALRIATQLCNNDLQGAPALELSNRLFQRHRTWLLPPLFNDPINDPIIKMYWSGMRSEVISIATQIESVAKNKTAHAAINYFPKTVANVLFLTFSVPKKLTKIVIMLTREEDFWTFLRAFKLWFERHDTTHQVQLVDKAIIALHGATLLPPPVHDESPLLMANELIADTPFIEAQTLVAQSSMHMVSADELSINREEESEHRTNTTATELFGDNPYLLFSGSRQRRKAPGDLQLDSADLYAHSK